MGFHWYFQDSFNAHPSFWSQICLPILLSGSDTAWSGLHFRQKIILIFEAYSLFLWKNGLTDPTGLCPCWEEFWINPVDSLWVNTNQRPPVWIQRCLNPVPCSGGAGGRVLGKQLMVREGRAVVSRSWTPRDPQGISINSSNQFGLALFVQSWLHSSKQGDDLGSCLEDDVDV